MWYDLKYKRQKMPKARANIYVYNSTLFSGLIFEDEMICTKYTTNCQVCGAKSSRNSRRCRKHERTSTYTAVQFTRKKNARKWKKADDGISHQTVTPLDAARVNKTIFHNHSVHWYYVTLIKVRYYIKHDIKVRYGIQNPRRGRWL